MKLICSNTEIAYSYYISFIRWKPEVHVTEKHFPADQINLKNYHFSMCSHQLFSILFCYSLIELTLKPSKGWDY